MTKHLKFRVQKFESHSVLRVEEYIVREISAFKSQFCYVLCSHNDEQQCLEKSGKRSNFVLEKSGKPQSDFCTSPVC